MEGTQAQMDYGVFDCLRVEIDRGVAFVTFDHPPLNLLDLPMTMDLARLCELLTGDDTVRVAVFQSSNRDYFLSHADLGLLQKARDEGLYDGDGVPFYSGLLERFRKMPKATVARLEGRARGGGAEFALALDMSFAAIGRATLSQMEIALGMLPGGGGARYLASRVGRARALEICLGGADLSAEEAEKYGLVNRALPADRMGPVVDELAYRIASYPAKAIALNKAAVDVGEADSCADLAATNALFAAAVKDPEFDRRVAAFLEKGGQTATGESADFATWAATLS